MKIRFPENISHHVKERVDNPFNTTQARKQVRAQYKGVISKTGNWIGPPISTWTIKHAALGDYIIQHAHGHKYYSVSFSTLGTNAKIEVVKNDEYVTEIKITDSDNQPVDVDFAICLSITDQLREG